MSDKDIKNRVVDLLMETIELGKRGGYAWKTIAPETRIQAIGSEVYRLGKGDLLDTFYTQVFQHAGQAPATELILAWSHLASAEDSALESALPLNVLWRRNSVPAAATTSQRFDPLAVKHRAVSTFLATATRITSWVYVKIGDVRFKTVGAMQGAAVQLSKLPMRQTVFVPIRDSEMVFPPGDLASNIQIIEDQENIKATKKFVRVGFWFSPYIAGGSLLGYNGRLYVVPTDRAASFCPQLKNEGPSAFDQLESFPDFHADPPDKDIILHEEFPPSSKQWWQFWK